MVDKEEVKKAYQKGYNDYKNHKAAGNLEGGRCNPFFHSCYVPTPGYEEAYEAGWHAAERDWDKEAKKILESLKSGEIREK